MVQLTMEINLNPVGPNNKESLQKYLCSLLITQGCPFEYTIIEIHVEKWSFTLNEKEINIDKVSPSNQCNASLKRGDTIDIVPPHSSKPNANRLSEHKSS